MPVERQERRRRHDLRDQGGNEFNCFRTHNAHVCQRNVEPVHDEHADADRAEVGLSRDEYADHDPNDRRADAELPVADPHSRCLVWIEQRRAPVKSPSEGVIHLDDHAAESLVRRNRV
jgi:hypothetical protein